MADILKVWLTEWADLLWLVPAVFLMERGKRLLTVGFVLACVLLLRLQVEFFTEIRHPRGFLGLMESAVLPRGLVVYGIFVALFLLLARLSRGSMGHVHLAASITMMIAAFCVSALVMVL